jgi:hypothetical protein
MAQNGKAVSTTRSSLETTPERRMKLNQISDDNGMKVKTVVNIMIDKFIRDCKKNPTHLILVKRELERESSKNNQE